MRNERLATMLAQLKDTSEVMVDLAYSALLYGSEEIADHVLAMEEKVDRLHTEFELAILELRETRPAGGLLGAVRLALAAEELADAAAMMADIVKKGGRAHHVVRMAIESADETIVVSEIAKNSVMNGRDFDSLGLVDDISMRVVAVKRNGEWIFNPQNAFVLKTGDLIIAQGPTEGREKLLTMANPLHTHG